MLKHALAEAHVVRRAANVKARDTNGVLSRLGLNAPFRVRRLLGDDDFDLVTRCPC